MSVTGLNNQGHSFGNCNLCLSDYAYLNQDKNNLLGGASCLLGINENCTSDDINNYSVHILTEYNIIPEQDDERIRIPQNVNSEQGVGFLKRYNCLMLETARALQHANTGGLGNFFSMVYYKSDKTTR